MQKQSVRQAVRGLCFLLVALLLFSAVSFVLERKTLFGPWNYMAKMGEFYDLEEDTLDYICVGSSHAYCTVNPLEVYNQNGLKGFVLATQQQPLRATYHYIVEAFKTQSPQVVFLEGYMVFDNAPTEGVLHDAVDPLSPSLNKMQMINALVEPGERDAYYFNVIKYHTRWRELSAEDMATVLRAPNDIYKGFVPLNGAFTAKQQIPDYEAIVATDIPAENREALEDIRTLVEENGAELVLLIAPYAVDNVKSAGAIKTAREWAAQNGVAILDYAQLQKELGVDPATDYYDGSHLDISGAAKVSRHLAGYLEQMGLTPQERSDAKWNRDWETYAENVG